MAVGGQVARLVSGTSRASFRILSVKLNVDFEVVEKASGNVVNVSNIAVQF
jgi:hypothetical protein